MIVEDLLISPKIQTKIKRFNIEEKFDNLTLILGEQLDKFSSVDDNGKEDGGKQD